MTKTKLIVVIAVTASVAVAATLIGVSLKRGYKHHRGKAKDRIYRQLNLSEQQMLDLQENRQAQRKRMSELRGSIREKQAQLQPAFIKPSADRASVEPVINEIKSLEAQSIESRVEAILAVKKILTPEQFEQFQKMMDSRKANRKGRFNGKYKKDSVSRTQKICRFKHKV